MPYQNFTTSIAVLTYAPWYRVQHLIDAIKAIRRINFSIVEQRQQALERINALISDSPFALMDRFATGEWVCEVLGNWPRLFQQLKSALNFKESASRKESSNGGGTKDPTSNYGFSNQSDAQVAFWNATTAIYDALTSVDSVWDRPSFEEFYDLEWEEPQE